MKLDSSLLAAALAGCAVWLHGCDDAEPMKWPGPTAAPPDGGRGVDTETTTTTTTSDPNPPRSDSPTKPTDAAKLAEELSGYFRDFDENNPDSPLGVPITWLKDTDKKLNLYCGDVPGNDDDGCFEGSADCRMSVVQHSSKTAVHLEEDGTRKVIQFSGRRVGVVFSTKLVDNYFGKCAFAYDGGANNRYNHGCGGGAPAGKESCENPNSAYGNVCPSSGKTCTGEDAEVEKDSCDNRGGHASSEDNKGCFYKLPSYDLREKDIGTHYNSTPTWKQESELRTMMQDRVAMDTHYDCDEQCWNEVILDTRLLLTQLWWDPLAAVPAIVFSQGDGFAQGLAGDVQAAFKESWGQEPTILAMNLYCNTWDPGCAMFSAPGAATAV